MDIYELRAVELEASQKRRFESSFSELHEFLARPFEQEQTKRIAQCRRQSRSLNKITPDGSKQEVLF